MHVLLGFAMRKNHPAIGVPHLLNPSFRDLTMGYFQTWPWHFWGTWPCNVWNIGDMKINHPWGGPWPQTVAGDPSSLSFFFSEQRGFKFTCPSKFRENEDEQFMMEGYWYNFPSWKIGSEFQVLFRETHNCTGVPNHGAGSKVFRLWDQIPAQSTPSRPHVSKKPLNPHGSNPVYSNVRNFRFSLHRSFPMFFFWCVFHVFFPCFSMFHIHPSELGPSQSRCWMLFVEKIRPCRHHPGPNAAVFPRGLDARGGPHGMAVPAICNQHVGFWWKKWQETRDLKTLKPMFFFWIEIHKKHDVAI